MLKKTDIFARSRLRPGQLRAVAERRLGDAEALCKTGSNDRANGAMYLAGFVVECLLKARLIERYVWLQNAGLPPAGAPTVDQRVWSLCYRSHDLDEILARLPDVHVRLSQLEQRESDSLRQSLNSICARWTVYVRYSPVNASIQEARVFLAQVKELKPWLQ